MDRVKASSASVSRRMSRQQVASTGPELALRREMHRRGLRYRVQVKLLDDRRRHDIVFSRARVVVDVMGCFWHGCRQHGNLPKSNTEWWARKIASNQARDGRTAADLKAAGWTLIRVWEHEDPKEAAERVERTVRSRQLGHMEVGEKLGCPATTASGPYPGGLVDGGSDE